MSYGTPISATIPTPESTVGPDYANDLQAWCQEVEARVETKVTEAGIQIGGSLELNSNELIEVTAAQFDNEAGTKTGAGNARKVYVSGGELYYTNNSGTTVRITSGGAIDVGSIKGITGDYSSDANAEIDYSTSTAKYRVRKHTGNDQHAQIQAGELRLMGTGTVPTLGVVIDVPTLAASYNMTLPTNKPASGTELVTMDSNGDMDHTATPTVTSLTVSANGDVTVSGTGEYTHGDKVLPLDPAEAAINSSVILPIGAERQYLTQLTSSAYAVYPVRLREGNRIRSLKARVKANSGDTITVALRKVNAEGASVNLSSGTYTATGFGWKTLSSIDHTMEADSTYRVEIYSDNAAQSVNNACGRVILTFDQP